MTLPDFFELLGQIPEGSTAAALVALSVSPMVIAGGLWAVRRLRTYRTLERRLEQLEHSLTVYAETATSVARTLDQLLLNRAPIDQQVHSSRRYLLQQARVRLGDGEPLVGIAHGLGLSRDEVQLLDRLGPAEILVGEPAAPASNASAAA